MNTEKNTIAERIFDFLKNYPPFELLSKTELLDIAKKVNVIYVQKEAFIFKQNETPHNFFYVVKDGAIGLYRDFDSEELLIDICDEGDLFGLRPLVQHDNYRMSARAKEESILYGISVELIKHFIATNAKVKKFIIASFTSNFKHPLTESKNEEWYKTSIQTNDKTTFLNDIQTAEYSKTPVICEKYISIQDAALSMTEKKVGSIIIVENNKPLGIITDKDLRTKIATGKTPIHQQVSAIMSSPVFCFPKNISVAEAQIAMIKHNITHLCITEDGTDQTDLVGLLSEHDIVVLQGENPSVLVKEIKRATNIEILTTIRKKVTKLISNYLSQQIPIDFVTKIVTEINDALTQKAIEFAILEMQQEPPVSFAWLALGSQGRKEQLLITDQDNALVFDDVSAIQIEETRNYFLTFAQKVTSILNTIGYEYCPAEMMASNPKWCLTTTEWKNQFHEWITNPTDEAILKCTIFFDFTLVYGNQEFVNQMQDAIVSYISKYQIFLNFLAKNAIQSPPPIGFFRQFLVENNGEHKNQFDLKSRALMPLIDAARTLTLSYQLPYATATLERYENLIKLEPQNEDLYQACIDSFKVLLRYRTKQGLKHTDSGRFVDLTNLTKSEKIKIRACFNPIKEVQNLLTNRFKLAQLG